MAKKNIESKDKVIETIVENPEAIAEKLEKSEEFLKKNKDKLSYIGIAIALIIGGLVYWNNYKTTLNDDAQNAMFQAVYYFEADSLDKALNGDGNNLGLLEIISDYEGTKAANLANFYVGVIYMKKGQFEDAIEKLKAFSSSDALVQARAYSLIADANMEMEKYDLAVEMYKKAATHKPNKYFTPQYLMKLALAFEEKGDMASSADVYNQIITEYPKSTEATEAKKYKAKAELTN